MVNKKKTNLDMVGVRDPVDGPRIIRVIRGQILEIRGQKK
jgi:hypothetical protein